MTTASSPGRKGPKNKPGRLSPAGKARAVANLKPWKPGQSGNPLGAALYRPIVEEAVAFYRANPEKLGELVDRMHRGAMGQVRVTMTQVAAFMALHKIVDRMHLKDDGSDRAQVQESITLVLPTDRKPERAAIVISGSEPPPHPELVTGRPVITLERDPDEPDVRTA